VLGPAEINGLVGNWEVGARRRGHGPDNIEVEG